MQNVDRMREVFKLAAREAKANRVASMTLLEQTTYILLVAGKQARDRRQYALALDYRLTYALCKVCSSIDEVWTSLRENDVLGSETAPNTPASNTGVTPAGATVPLEYFTRGK